ncbi:uncharacterized protein A4U43_C07F9560 [Asparagus officinalis]|uniref:Uncharacterized protein n=1 Tax=Asparagus officinalis TaxID=4686 RepID=A0A5P1ECI8_ASPOF|nr:uncharacterized protein A4U43_C07F9560 [Asparagus officinalis]
MRVGPVQAGMTAGVWADGYSQWRIAREGGFGGLWKRSSMEEMSALVVEEKGKMALFREGRGRRTQSEWGDDKIRREVVEGDDGELGDEPIDEKGGEFNGEVVGSGKGVVNGGEMIVAKGEKERESCYLYLIVVMFVHFLLIYIG